MDVAVLRTSASYLSEMRRTIWFFMQCRYGSHQYESRWVSYDGPILHRSE